MTKSTTLLWWTLSLLLIALGLFGIVFMSHGPLLGPSLSKPIGRTSLSPSQLSTTSSKVTHVAGTTTSTTTSSQALSMATHVVLASFDVTRVPSTTATSSLGQSRYPRSSPKIVAARPLSRSRPVHLTIPAIGVSVTVGELGLNHDGTVQVPTNFAQPGWYKFGPAPGQIGSAVILGHVDNTTGPKVFFYLDRLRPGDRILVRSANGRTLQFVVIGLRMFAKQGFPDRLVYGPRHYAALQLVTCGGVFDHQTGSYLSNMVVFAALVKV